jgi:Uncharacterized homolog of phage Mu protein gp47
MALNLETLGLSATVTDQGIVAPDYQTILEKLTEYFRQIYGEDAYLDPDSKDGQMVALYALGIHDANNTAIDVYNSFSPATGRGRALASNVKINGIARKLSTNSTADLVLSGDTGTLIPAGIVRDDNGVQWALPVNVNIPANQTITVTATCTTPGAVAALAGTIKNIATPTRGWRSVTNPAAATVGTPVESDAQLRGRQARSTALPSQTTLDGMAGALLDVTGVTRLRIYENDTNVSNANGLPAHSICAVVEGGAVKDIAEVLSKKKDQGTATFGTTSVDITGKYGEAKTIRFSRPTVVSIFVEIELTTYTGYTSQIAEEMKATIAAYINSLRIGESVLLSRIYSPANLGVMSGGDSRYYDITSLKIGKTAAAVSAANVAILFNEAAAGATGNIKVTAT